MNIIEKIMSRFGYMKGDRIGEIFQSQNRNSLTSYGLTTPANYDKLLTAYANEVWIYACIYLVATTIAGLPWRLYKTKIKNNKLIKETVWNDEVYRLFNRPNDNDENSTFFNLIEMTVATTELIGNGYWLLDKLRGNPAPGSLRKPQSIQSLIGSKMRVSQETDSLNLIDGYNYILPNGQPHKFKKEEIVHFKYMSVNNYHYGQGSLTPALWSIDTIKEAQIANLNIFKNGLKLDAFFETDQNISEASFTRFKKQVDDKYKGADKQHQTMLLEKGLKYKAITGNMKELEFINGIKLSREDICAVIGVPTLLVGILDKASYANYETAMKVLFVFNIIPKTKRLNAVISHVVQRFDKSLFFEFDLTNEDALKEDEERKSRIATAYFAMGVPFNVVNQRLNLGFDKIEGGDTGFLPFSLQPVSFAAAGPPDPAEPAAGNDEDDDDDKSKKVYKIVYNKEKKLALWKQFNRTAGVIEKRYMKLIEIYFMGLEIGILRRLESSKQISVEHFIFDEAEEIARWQTQSGKIHKLSMKTNGDRELVNLGLGSTFDLSNPIVVDYLDKYGLEKATEVIENAAERTRQTLIAGIENGEGIPQLKKRIQAAYEPYTNQGYKATRIARTEVIGTSNRGALEAYRQAGVGVKKAWLNEPDARDNHRDAGIRYSEGNAIALNEDFHVGAGQGEAPGNIGLAEEDINCRCSILPVVE